MSENKDPDFLQKAVITNANTVGVVLTTGAGLAGIILLVKLTGSDNFKFFDAQYPVVYSWFPFVIFTFAHWYTAILLVKAINELKAKGDYELCRSAWREVIATGNLFVRGAVAEMKQHPKNPKLWIRNPGDPSVIFTLVAMAGMVFAIVPFDLLFVLLGKKSFELSQVVSTIVLVIAAIVFAAVNWLIGGNWLVLLAQLSKENKN